MRSRANLSMHELLGTTARVAKSACKEFEGISGMVTDETKNTLLLQSAGKTVRVPKKGCTFEIEYAKGKKTRMLGEQIAYRPEERIKKARQGKGRSAKEKK